MRNTSIKEIEEETGRRFDKPESKPPVRVQPVVSRRHRWKVIAHGEIPRLDYVKCTRCGLYATRGDCFGVKCKG